jgi:hypothetical protein
LGILTQCLDDLVDSLLDSGGVNHAMRVSGSEDCEDSVDQPLTRRHDDCMLTSL